MINFTNFKISSVELKKYIDKSISSMVKENDLDNRDKVIFISTPTTGVDDYEDKYNKFRKLVEAGYVNKNVFIFCPDYYIKQIPEELNPTYLDKIFYGLRMLDLCDVMYINDENYEEWEHSRGCLLESLYCKEQDIPMINYKYLVNGYYKKEK